MESPTSSRTGSRQTILLAAGLFLLAFLLRLAGANRNMWGDELTTCWILPQDWGFLTRERMASGHMPVYFWILKLFTGLVGMSKMAARFPSVTAGAFSAAAVFLLARRWLPTRTALVAGLLMALNGVNLYLSQTARMYAVTQLLEIAFFALLLQMLSTPTRRTTILYGAVIFLGCSIHLLFLRQIFSALVIALLFFRMAGPEWRRASVRARGRRLLAVLAPFLVCLPLWLAYSQLRHQNLIDDPFIDLSAGYPHPPPKPLALARIPQDEEPFHFSESLREVIAMPFGDFRRWDGLKDGRPEALAQGVVALWWGVLMVFAFRAKEGGAGKSPPPGILAAVAVWAFVPIGLMLALDLIRGNSLITTRYISGSTAGLSILLAVGWQRLPLRGMARAAALAVLIALPAFCSLGWATSPHEGQRDVLKYWQAHREPGEKTFLMHAGYWLVAMQMERIPEPAPDLLEGTARLDFTSEELAGRLDEFVVDADSVWFLRFPPLERLRPAEAFPRMESRWTVCDTFTSGYSQAYHLRRVSSQ